MEVWRDAPGYPGYQVSSEGHIRSERGLLSPWPNDGGYNVVSLRKNGRYTKVRVHRLVALAFCAGDSRLTVDHIDSDRQNNRSVNLRWLPRSTNTAIALSGTIRPYLYGEKTWRCWIPIEKVREARRLFLKGCPKSLIQQKTGVRPNLFQTDKERRPDVGLAFLLEV